MVRLRADAEGLQVLLVSLSSCLLKLATSLSCCKRWASIGWRQGNQQVHAGSSRPQFPSQLKGLLLQSRAAS